MLGDLFFNNEENEDDNWEIVRRREHLKINHYFENVVLNYSLTGNKTTRIFMFLFYDVYIIIFLHYFIILSIDVYNSMFIIVFLYRFIIDFKSHFRVERNTFEHLIQTFGAALLEDDNSPKLPPAKQLAIALWFFGNQEVYRLIIKIFYFILKFQKVISGFKWIQKSQFILIYFRLLDSNVTASFDDVWVCFSLN